MLTLQLSSVHLFIIMPVLKKIVETESLLPTPLSLSPFTNQYSDTKTVANRFRPFSYRRYICTAVHLVHHNNCVSEMYPYCMPKKSDQFTYGQLLYKMVKTFQTYSIGRYGIYYTDPFLSRSIADKQSNQTKTVVKPMFHQLTLLSFSCTALQMYRCQMYRCYSLASSCISIEDQDPGFF